MREFTAQVLVESGCQLGEGIQWRPAERQIVWTDILGRKLFWADADGKAARTLDLPERLCSFAFDPDGMMLAAFESGLFALSPSTGHRRRLTHFEPDRPATRMNDGRCDRAGSFVVGGVDERDHQAISSVIHFEGHTQTTLLSGIGCTNSIAFSPDGCWMYLADTFARRIDRLPYGPGASVHDRQSFVAFEMSDGFPDGSCIDSEGALWNAQFEGGTVRRFLPEGTLDAIIHVDAPQVTCCCFGGPDLHTMFITTARENMDATRVAQHPHSGHVFSVQLPFRGLPESILAFCVEL